MTKRKIDFKQVLYLILIGLLIIFVVQNLDSTMVKFFTFSFELPLIILIAIVFFIGFFSAKIFKKVEPKKTVEEKGKSIKGKKEDMAQGENDGAEKKK